MIPKIIHYCWFGKNEKPKLAKRCIESWKKYCSDFKIVEWNEDNFNLNENEYVKYCYENRKWAYLSDYVRLSVVQQYGGVYFDTDVELVAPIDFLLENQAFYAFETASYVATGLGFGSEASHKIIEAMTQEYEKLKPYENTDFKFIGCPRLNTKTLKEFGLQTNGQYQKVQGAVILPKDYMNPYDDPTGRLTRTENTISIHWYSKSALSRATIYRSKITRIFHRLFGVNCLQWIRK